MTRCRCRSRVGCRCRAGAAAVDPSRAERLQPVRAERLQPVPPVAPPVPPVAQEDFSSVRHGRSIVEASGAGKVTSSVPRRATGEAARSAELDSWRVQGRRAGSSLQTIRQLACGVELQMNPTGAQDGSAGRERGTGARQGAWDGSAGRERGTGARDGSAGRERARQRAWHGTWHRIWHGFGTGPRRRTCHGTWHVT
jgi:hypothetical protein